MSYHLNMQKDKKPEIEMPPLPETVEVATQPAEKPQELHPELQNALPFEAQQVEEPVVEQVEQPQEEIKASKENKANIREMRAKAERAERAERERDELFRKLQEMEAMRTQAQPKQEEPEVTIDPEGLVEGKHLSKYDKKIRQLEDKLKGYEQQNHLTAAEVRLKNQYPDFDKIVSRENIEELKAAYPELAETLNTSSTDIYSKAVSAYTLIKKLGISPNEDVYQQDKERIVKNAVKPRPLASISPQQGDSPLSKANAFANGLTDELKSQLRKEMYAAMKNN